jgi:shikimate dehydrogenase
MECRDYGTEIDAQSRLTGVIGYPLSHTLSPLINNLAFGRMGLNWVYLPLRVAPGMLSVALSGLKALGCVGVNVTIPYKLEACRLSDSLKGDAVATGSVNTLKIGPDGGTITGYSTDGAGFVRSLEEALGALPEGRLFLIGAGGAARAVAYTLAVTGKIESVQVCNRTRGKAEELAALLMKTPAVKEARCVELAASGLAQAAGASLIVNTLPAWEVDVAGMAKPGLFKPGQSVCDLDYMQERSAFLRMAEEAGSRVLNGRGMLVHQAAESLRIWTGMEPPVEAMRTALEEYLAGAAEERTA